MAADDKRLPGGPGPYPWLKRESMRSRPGYGYCVIALLLNAETMVEQILPDPDCSCRIEGDYIVLRQQHIVDRKT